MNFFSNTQTRLGMIATEMSVRGWRFLRFERWAMTHRQTVNWNYGVKVWRFKIFVSFV